MPAEKTNDLGLRPFEGNPTSRSNQPCEPKYRRKLGIFAIFEGQPLKPTGIFRHEVGGWRVFVFVPCGIIPIAA